MEYVINYRVYYLLLPNSRKTIVNYILLKVEKNTIASKRWGDSVCNESNLHVV